MVKSFSGEVYQAGQRAILLSKPLQLQLSPTVTPFGNVKSRNPGWRGLPLMRAAV